MKATSSILALALLATPAVVQATDASAWPPKISFGRGTELALTGNLQYDFNDFHGSGYNDAALEDDDAWRRQELGLSLKRKGVYDFGATFDLDRPAFRRHPVAIIHGNDRGVYGQQQAVHG